MLNPDGVVVGNYRTGSVGVDENRIWQRPSKYLHPTVWAAKQLIRRLLDQTRIPYFIDLHGHSKLQHWFAYGSVSDEFDDRAFVAQMAKLSSTFGPQHCQFKVNKSKQSTARVVVQGLGVPDSVTIEASFCGANGRQFTTRDYRAIGAAVVGALARDCQRGDVKE